MDTSTQTDPVLNSVSSFELFFKNNYPAACLVALRYLKDEQQTEDIVQETFMYLWQKRAELKVERNLKQYLFCAVKNRSINYLKREKQFDQQITPGMDNYFTDDREADFTEEELAARIAGSIESLPSQCKKIFLLAYQENLTYGEIASALNLSKNTIKTQMGIAYKVLREKLKNYVLTLFMLPFRQFIR